MNRSTPKKGKNRQSWPLVYTEFRSPEAASQSKNGSVIGRASVTAQAQDQTQNHGVTMATSQDVVTRHSFVTAIENIGTNAVWIVLLLPTVSALLMYCLTVQWRYTTFIQPIQIGAAPPVLYKLPASEYQLSFVRSLVIINGYHCHTSACEDNQLTINADLLTRVTDRNAELSAQTLLYTTFPLADFVEEFYSPMHNDSIHTNQSILIPLPMLHLDTPLLSRSTIQYVTFTSRFGDQDDDGGQSDGAKSSSNSIIFVTVFVELRNTLFH